MNIAASAPGKLVLLGEYAVLEGAPAVAMAVDRRAVAKLTAQPGPRCEVFAPDVLKARTPFSIGSNGLPDWQAAGADAARLSLVDEVLRGLADEGLAPAAGSGFKLALSYALIGVIAAGTYVFGALAQYTIGQLLDRHSLKAVFLPLSLLLAPLVLASGRCSWHADIDRSVGRLCARPSCASCPRCFVV